MSQNTDEKVRQVTAQYAREAQEAEERARKAQAAQNQAQKQEVAAASQRWMDWVDARIRAHFEQRVALLEAHVVEHPDGKTPIVYAAVGNAIAHERDKRDDAIARRLPQRPASLYQDRIAKRMTAFTAFDSKVVIEKCLCRSDFDRFYRFDRFFGAQILLIKMRAPFISGCKMGYHFS